MKVIILGGSSGIGKGLALKHAAQGDELVLVARTERDLQTVARGCMKAGAKRCNVVPADVTSLAECIEMEKRIGKDPIDLVHITLGAGSHQVKGTAWQPTDETSYVYDKMMQVNFFGVLNVLRVLLPTLHASRSHIVVLNSASGLIGLPGRAAYCASKAALNSLCETLIADASHSITLTEVFIVSVSGTNLRAKGITQGLDSTAPHTGSSSEIPVGEVVDIIFKKAQQKTRRVYIPSKIRAISIVKHIPFIPADGIIEKLVWRKARL
eukprot:TRINITY_DN21794_c0_g1_i1.p1 TRINITY_DN21794_c0_g1~~TRINITY_DN21794_c0_g1_i1.p1  ORF type:complete len:285 (+),score=63.35 TRINITY_DN21794_c0_g1_i1:57-857(+)